MKKIILLIVLITIALFIFFLIKKKTVSLPNGNSSSNFPKKKIICIPNGESSPNYSSCCSGDAFMGAGGLICAPKLPTGEAY